MKLKPFIIQGVIAIVVIIVGIIVARSYLQDEVSAKRRTRVDSGILVEVVPVERENHVVEITGNGQVEVSRRQSIKSEANGRVTWVNPAFYPGARIAKGDIIAKINTDDYEIKLSNAKIQLRQREVSLMLEEAKGRAAKNELEALKKTMSDTKLSDQESALVRREPQLQNAIADVELAKNNLRQAQLDYNRSIVKCPYDAIVETANISLGDYVSGATALGSMIATDEYWVYLSLNPANVGWLGVGGDLEALEAKVEYDIGGQTVTRQAHVKSVQPSVESLGRMVQVLLSVEDPLGEPVDSPLLVGAFVRAKIYAREPLSAIRLPRAHVREGNQAYVCTPENKLSIRQLTTPYRNDEYVFVTEGLEAGERVVTTLISSPVEGRKLRVKGETNIVGEVSDDVGRGGRGGGGFGGPR
ncbi:MAG: efflux RND transporter periplasmic adaptor subunit [Proteobacteria bacterium]|nr:efflux RND transporter periplasmic adaptor subunit [Pseudomonadota bacterium]